MVLNMVIKDYSLLYGNHYCIMPFTLYSPLELINTIIYFAVLRTKPKLKLFLVQNYYKSAF